MAKGEEADEARGVDEAEEENHRGDAMSDCDGCALDIKDTDRCDGSWWVLCTAVFLDLLRRAANGEEPDLLLMEHMANCEREARDE